MTEADTVALIDKIEMGVDLKDVNIALVVKCVDAGDVNGMITSKSDGKCACFENCTHTGFDIGVAFHRVGVNDIGIAYVYDADRGR